MYSLIIIFQFIYLVLVLERCTMPVAEQGKPETQLKFCNFHHKSSLITLYCFVDLIIIISTTLNKRGNLWNHILRNLGYRILYDSIRRFTFDIGCSIHWPLFRYFMLSMYDPLRSGYLKMSFPFYFHDVPVLS